MLEIKMDTDAKLDRSAKMIRDAAERRIELKRELAKYDITVIQHNLRDESKNIRAGSSPKRSKSLERDPESSQRIRRLQNTRFTLDLLVIWAHILQQGILSNASGLLWDETFQQVQVDASTLDLLRTLSDNTIESLPSITNRQQSTSDKAKVHDLQKRIKHLYAVGNTVDIWRVDKAKKTDEFAFPFSPSMYVQLFVDTGKNEWKLCAHSKVQQGNRELTSLSLQILRNRWSDPALGNFRGARGFWHTLMRQYIGISEADVSMFLKQQELTQITSAPRQKGVYEPLVATDVGWWQMDLIVVKFNAKSTQTVGAKEMDTAGKAPPQLVEKAEECGFACARVKYADVVNGQIVIKETSDPRNFTGTQDINFILTIIDLFSKFVWAFPIRNKKADTVVSLLENLWLTEGAPLKIQSDRGTEFVNDSMFSLAARFGVKRVFCAPYNSQCDGVIERFNRTLQTSISRALYEYNNNNWKELLPLVVHGYNSTRHSSTKLSPFLVYRGREPPPLGNVQLRPLKVLPLEESIKQLQATAADVEQQIKESNVTSIRVGDTTFNLVKDSLYEGIKARGAQKAQVAALQQQAAARKTTLRSAKKLRGGADDEEEEDIIVVNDEDDDEVLDSSTLRWNAQLKETLRNNKSFNDSVQEHVSSEERKSRWVGSRAGGKVLAQNNAAFAFKKSVKPLDSVFPGDWWTTELDPVQRPTTLLKLPNNLTIQCDPVEGCSFSMKDGNVIIENAMKLPEMQTKIHAVESRMQDQEERRQQVLERLTDKAKSMIRKSMEKHNTLSTLKPLPSRYDAVKDEITLDTDDKDSLQQILDTGSQEGQRVRLTLLWFSKHRKDDKSPFTRASVNVGMWSQFTFRVIAQEGIVASKAALPRVYIQLEDVDTVKDEYKSIIDANSVLKSSYILLVNRNQLLPIPDNTEHPKGSNHMLATSAHAVWKEDTAPVATSADVRVGKLLSSKRNYSIICPT